MDGEEGDEAGEDEEEAAGGEAAGFVEAAVFVLEGRFGVVWGTVAWAGGFHVFFWGGF